MFTPPPVKGTHSKKMNLRGVPRKGIPGKCVVWIRRDDTLFWNRMSGTDARLVKVIEPVAWWLRSLGIPRSSESLRILANPTHASVIISPDRNLYYLPIRQEGQSDAVGVTAFSQQRETEHKIRIIFSHHEFWST